MPAAKTGKDQGALGRTERTTRVVAALIGAVLTVGIGNFALLRIGDPLVSLSYDLPFIFHRAGNSNELRIVYLNKANEDVLDRRPQAQLLDKLAKAGAKTVIYDVIFDIPSADPQVDEEFADSIRRFRGVDATGKPLPGVPQRHVLLACGRKTINTAGAVGEQLIPPIDALLDAADDFGIVAFDDEEYMIRKLSTGSKDEPSLIWKTAVVLDAGLDEKTRTSPRWVNYSGPPEKRKTRGTTSTIPSCGSDSVMLSTEDSGFFRDKVVIVGGEPGIVGEALGKDLFSTPFHRLQFGEKLPLMSGVEVQANGLANLLRKNWLNRSSHAFDLIITALCGIIVGAGLSFLRPLRAILIALCLSLGGAIAGTASMRYGNFWFPWSVVSFLQVPAALVWGIASSSYIERFFRIKISAEQEAIRAAFAKYLSPQMLERLTSQGFTTNLGGESVQAAMMFTDLESFTDMCDRIRDPQRIVQTLNDYFERTTASIFDNDGVIIKYIGDAIFAAWGAPVADPHSPIKAVHAAWKLFESDKLVVDGVSLRTRIGLNYGDVVSGNIGSSRRVDYTLIGDAVNLTARLEGLNKMLGTHILMSESIQTHLDQEYRTRRVGKFQVKGRKEHTVVYELLGPAREQKQPDWIDTYERAIDSLNANCLASALPLFEAVNQQRGPQGDGPSRFMIEWIKSGALIIDGIIELKEK